MPKLNFEIEYPYIESFRTAKIAGMFDLSPTEKLKKSWDIDLPIEELNNNWNIGLIVGASGSGKTILSKKIFGEENYHKGFVWNNETSFLNDFSQDLDINLIVDTLSHIGFSSPPSWLLPFNKLSNGQQFRAEIARAILEHKNLFVVDEFTSVVDRNVAKIGCAAIQKNIRKNNKQMVAVSCHYDIIEWLEPDWYYDVSSNQYFRGRLHRPKIQLEVYKCDKTCWELFKQHHYLSTNISPSAQCFIGLINDEPTCFTSYINFPHNVLKNCRREHRTVVLPDYQGVGLGNKISEFAADLCVKQGHIYLSTTSHPAMIHYRNKNKKWRLKRSPSIIPNVNNYDKNRAGSFNRLTASFQYLGD
jgi:ABC-type ATPase involved in cell division